MGSNYNNSSTKQPLGGLTSILHLCWGFLSDNRNKATCSSCGFSQAFSQHRASVFFIHFPSHYYSLDTPDVTANNHCKLKQLSISNASSSTVDCIMNIKLSYDLYRYPFSHHQIPDFQGQPKLFFLSSA